MRSNDFMKQNDFVDEALCLLLLDDYGVLKEIFINASDHEMEVLEYLKLMLSYDKNIFDYVARRMKLESKRFRETGKIKIVDYDEVPLILEGEIH